ncbi:sigma-54-dependent Fis family transcriptional regulator [candidate division LCP-89 bacterium B3_LCP]|uniref:Sigma-54-dependent Fis family transcriptional regulator n=1 Tax=candidate division LCP-89 bacterium B3_LCP TaxID=2012998 RepID=A0A532V3L2_UNCL8|nr:MAG: sigma-54-dependent Fis family transcriptional regulator [candidate division LCP-89 bacterium B3_LCP]
MAVTKNNFFGLVGETPQIQQLKSVVQQVAPTDITVLVTGESGTGKELIANAIHSLSSRRDKSLITVNCGAIPEGIFESEVFGHVRGAFTSADRTRKGYFETAHGSSIFLDEIGEMPLEAQAKVLRVLEMGEFMKVGSSHNEKVDVRVIAATNKDLSEAVSTGRFRQDLFFRLKAVNIYLPPLRNRKDDIPLLVEHFLADTCQRNDIPCPHITPEAMNLLKNAYWEGNVRELKHFLDSLVILERGRTLDEHIVGGYLRQNERRTPHLPVHVPKGSPELDRELLVSLLLDLKRDIGDIKNHLQIAGSANLPATWMPGREIIQTEPQVTLEEMEKEQIHKSLQEVRGNRRKAAEILGISERTLYRKLKEYNIS